MTRFKLILAVAGLCASAFAAASNPTITSADVPNGLSVNPSANGVTLRGFRLNGVTWQQVSVTKHVGSSFTIPGGVIGVAGYNNRDQNWGEGSRTLDNIGANEKLRADVVNNATSATINASIYKTGSAAVVVTMFDGVTPVDTQILPVSTGNNQPLTVTSGTPFNRIEIGFPIAVASSTVSGATLVGVNSISFVPVPTLLTGNVDPFTTAGASSGNGYGASWVNIQPGSLFNQRQVARFNSAGTSTASVGSGAWTAFLPKFVLGGGSNSESVLTYRQNAGYTTIDLSNVKSMSFDINVNAGSVSGYFYLMDWNGFIAEVPSGFARPSGASTVNLDLSTAAIDPGFDLSKVMEMKISISATSANASFTVTNFRYTYVP